MTSVKFDKNTKIWSHCGDPLLYNANISMAHILLRSMELHASKIAQINDDTGEQLTFEQLRLMTIRAAQNLQMRGYNSNHMIGINSGNVSFLTPIVLASICIGCPINPLYSEWCPDILDMFEKTQPKLVFCEIELYELTRECLIDLGIDAKMFTLNGVKGDAESVENLFCETGTEEEFVPVNVDGINEIAFIMGTSGTTGPSKGVCLSHAGLLSRIRGTNVKLHSNGIVFNSSSLGWVSGLITLLASLICGSTRIQTAEEFTIEMQLRLIEKFKITYVKNVPAHLMQMLESDVLPNNDLSSLKHMSIIGYRAPMSIFEELNSHLPNACIHNAYGLSELGTVSMNFPKFSGKETVGRLVNGVTVKIIDETGKRCDRNVNGEICIKPQFKFLGYFKNQQLTDELIDTEGFFMSGDIGHFDDDDDLFIVDRKKNVINGRDDWIYPSEIEEVLLESPDIKSVCVVGVPCDAIFEVPAAAIVRAEGSKITEEEINQLLEDNELNDCLLDGGVYFVDSIPMSARGKPLHRDVRSMAIKLYNTKLANKSACDMEMKLLIQNRTIHNSTSSK